MEYAVFVEHVRRDGQQLAAVARYDLSAPVPSCPGWSVDDLVRHVAEVYEHKIACTVLGTAPDPWPPEWPSSDPIEWLSGAHVRLLQMFDRSEPTTPSATWWPPDQTVGFWARRMAHETAVHRVDAELAAGTPTPIDDELATDGVAEVLAIMLAGDWSDEPDDRSTGQRIAVTTGGREWEVILQREAIEVNGGIGSGAPTAGLAGEPTDVDLWLWGRVPDDRIALSGDADAIRRLRSRLALATQ